MPLRLSASALRGHDPAAPIVALGGATMGTSWRVLYAEVMGVSPGEVEAGIVARLDGFVAEMSHWEPTSLLSRFNRLPAGRWAALPPDFATVIAAGLDVAERSGGAFDPAIGALVDLWGFGAVPADRPPTDDALAAAAKTSGWRRLAYDVQARRLRQPGGLRLDLSGIAKGYAVDAVARLVAGVGIGHALVEVGGELRGSGMRPDGDPWWVDLETPPDSALLPLRVALHDLAVATSGDRVRGFHTIDPATGRPARHGIRAASVLHASATIADAWASALIALPAERGAALAAAEGLAVRLVTDEGEWLSPALAAML